MTETLASEHELAAFLEQQQRDTLATWHRERSHEELANFVERRMDLLEDAF